MAIGPVEYIVVGFPGNKFKGEIAPALAKLVEDKTVRILDLLFIGKDTDGTVVTFEVDDIEGVASFAVVDGEIGGLIGQDDISHAAAGLEPKKLAGRRVRVRGWIEERGGPWIEAARPEQR